MSRISVFGNKKRTALDILRDSLEIKMSDFDRGYYVWSEDKIDDKGRKNPGWIYQPNVSKEVVISFMTNEGKGTGRQVIPLTEFKEYVDVLRQIIKSDYEYTEEEDPSKYIPTYKIAKNSFAMIQPKENYIDPLDNKPKTRVMQGSERSIVSIRSKSGQGAKPLLVDKNEFEGVVSLLEDLLKDLPDLVNKLNEAEVKKEQLVQIEGLLDFSDILG